MAIQQFFPYSWHIDEEEIHETYIRIYGLDQKNENVCLRINNFTPYVYLELPETNTSDTNIAWNTSNSQQVCNKLDELLGEHKPISKTLQFKKRLYYADLDQSKKRRLFPFLFLQFSSQASIKQLCYKTKRDMLILGIGKIKLKVHEQDASPILQLTCIRDIPTAGWINFVGKKIKQDDKLTTCDHEYIVPWKNLTKNIENNDIVARPLIMGFDIEVNSTNPSAMPNAGKTGDVVFQISCVLGRQGDSDDKWKTYLLSLGDPDQNLVGDDVEIRRYDTEADILLGYTQFIQEFNPNIIVGYNILGFDIPYMIARSKTSHVIYDFDKQGFFKDAHAKEKTIKWSSSAYKNQEFQFLDAEGRLYVDLLPLVKRDYKMDNYKLKTIATFFLGKENTKDPLDAKGIFKCYRIGMKGGEKGRKAISLVGKYCFVEGTQVSAIHGNISIEKLIKNNTNILSWDSKTNKLIISKQSNFFNNGIHKCIELEFEDGRKLLCTHDHLISDERGNWIEAYKININSRVKIGPILPNVDIDNRDMILARIIGYLLTDGHIGKDSCALFIGNLMDAQNIILDINFLCGKNPIIGKDANCWRISMPRSLIKIIKQIKGIEIGNRTDGNHGLPDMTSWSDSVIKEFLGGIFGGDGWCPSLTKDNKFSNIGLTQSRRNKDSIVEFMNIISTYLKKYGISCNIRICDRNKLYIGSLTIPKKYNELFATTIGYRYCYHKTLRTSVSVIYYRFRNRANIMRKCLYDSIIELVNKGISIHNAYNTCIKKIEMAEYMPKYSTIKNWISKGILDRRPDQISRNFPKPNMFVIMIGAENIYTTSCSNKYALSKNDTSLPTFSLKLIGKKEIGERNVYDIEVENTHSFLAEGIVVHNCVKDSIITVKLMEKLQTWVGLTEMARVCNTSIFSLYTAGQQIKVYSQVYKNCMTNNFVVEKDGYITAEDEHYTGAHVFDPITGVHDNVVPFDFMSLYPSCIIAYNIDYSTLVRDDSISDRLCHVVAWADHQSCIHDPKIIEKERLTTIINIIEKEIKDLRSKRDKSMSKLRKTEIKEEIDKKILEKKPFIKQRSEVLKTKHKHIMCVQRKYRFLKEPKGVMPTILQNLLDARANTRKQMKEYSKKLQTLHGSEKSDLETLINVLDKRQLAFKISSNSMYGAMGVVRGYLPFMPGAMATTAMGRKNIEIAANAIQEKYKGKLIYGDSITGDTPIIIKYPNGLIDIKTIETISNEDSWTSYEGFKISEGINSNRTEKQQSSVNLQVWSNGYWTDIKRIIRHKTLKRLYRINTHIGCLDVTEDHSLLTENCQKIKPTELKVGDKILHGFPNSFNNISKNNISKTIIQDDTDKIPMYILNGTKDIRTKFLEDFMLINKTTNFGSTNKLFTQSLFYLLKSLDYVVFVSIFQDYIILNWDMLEKNIDKYIDKCAIINIIDLGYNNINDFVYDLEADGKFHAGVGEIIPANTDSNYVMFPHLDGKPASELWDYCEYVAKEVSNLFPDSITLAYEEVIYKRFLILTKKRYMYLACDRNGVISNKVGKKGVLLARRDNSQFIRTLYGDIIMKLFNKYDIDQILYELIQEINKLCGSAYPSKDFVVTKAVGALEDYKIKPLPENPEKRQKRLSDLNCTEKDYNIKCLPAQVQLAEKMRSRGMRVDPGSRLEYVITVGAGHKAKQSEKVEDVDYYRNYADSGILKIDYMYYLKLLAMPLDQVFRVVYGHDFMVDKYKYRMNEFVLNQYKYRLKLMKVHEELLELFAHNIEIVDIKFVIEE
jgi:DNA polymerase elongation subunit (family B)